MKQQLKAILVDDDEVVNGVHSRLVGHVLNTSRIKTYNNPLDVIKDLTKDFDPSTTPEFVFVDMEMPEMDGVQLVDELDDFYSSNEFERPKFFMITGTTYMGDFERINRTGVIDDVIKKPLTYTKIMNLIQKHQLVSIPIAQAS